MLLKNTSIITCIILFLTSMLFAEVIQIDYPDSWGVNGFSLDSQSSTGVEVNFSITRLYIEDRIVDGETMKALQVPGIFLFNETGAPDLSGTGRYIAIPQGAIALYNITASRIERMYDIEISPAPRIPLETEEGPLEYIKDMEIYGEDAFYPENIVQLSEPAKIRGVDAVMLGITPFQYNPVTKEIIIYRDLKVEVSFNGGNGQFGEDRLRSRWWDPLLRDIFLNQESLAEVDFNRVSNSENQDFEYVVIVPDDPDFINWANEIKNWRTLQGIRTGVVTLTEIGGNDANLIENWVDNAYNTWTIPPSAILLLADHGTSGNTIVSPDHSHPYSGSCISDNEYADVDGDHLPDIVFARITARNASELQITVDKVLNYEKTPPTNPDFYNHPVTSMGYQSDRWFQLCSEIVYGFYELELGKQPVRENAGYTNGSAPPTWSTNVNTYMILDYFGPNGLGYVPATPSHLTDWGGNASRINNDLNSGAFMILHRDHGEETGWYEPSYHISDLSGLNNTDLTFVLSINCLTGKFNYNPECFAEAFHRYHKRALGIIAASEISYSFVNDTYTWGMYDNMWPDFMTTFGTTPASSVLLPSYANVAGKYFLEQSSWPYNSGSKEITYYLFHYHGDAFSTVYTEIPQQLTVVHDDCFYPNQTSFYVTADAGALIALTSNGEILGTATGTGAPVAIPISPQDSKMIVTVTKQNFYRYSQSVKGHMMANTDKATAYNNGRRIMQDPRSGMNDCWHFVYEDNNEIYFTGSTDDGANWDWEYMVSGISNNETTYKTPSLASYLTGSKDDPEPLMPRIGFTWQEDYNGEPWFVSCRFWDMYSNSWSNTDIWLTQGDEIDCLPVIAPAYRSNGDYWIHEFYVLYHDANGLVLLRFEGTGSSYHLMPVENPVPGTNENSINPSISSHPDYDKLYFCWEEEGHIYYNYYNVEAEQIGLASSYRITPDLYSGSYNSKPCITYREGGEVDIVWQYWDGETGTRFAHTRIDALNPGEDEPQINYVSLWSTNLTQSSAGAFESSEESDAVVMAGSNGFRHLHFDGIEWDLLQNIYDGKYPGLNDVGNQMMAVWTDHTQGFPYLIEDEILSTSGGEGSKHLTNLNANYFREQIIDLSTLPGLQLEGKASLSMGDIQIHGLNGSQPWQFIELSDSLEPENFQRTVPVAVTSDMHSVTLKYKIKVWDYVPLSGLPSLPLFHLKALAGGAQTGATLLQLGFYGFSGPQFQIEDSLTFNITPFQGKTICLRLRSIANLLNNPETKLYLINEKEYHEISPPENVAALNSEQIEIPTSYQFYQNYPNPFNPTTTIAFDLPVNALVQMDIYDITGRKIRTLINRQYPAGSHQVIWDGTDRNGNQAASGVYVYRLWVSPQSEKAVSFIQNRKMLLMK